MKILSFLLCFLISSATNSSAQINLEWTFPASFGTNNSFSVVKFSLGGDKYVYEDRSTETIEIYNLNQVLEKTIHFPSFVTATNNYTIAFLSDGLFDLDSKIEYFVSVYPTSGPSPAHAYIINEDSVMLLSRDSVPYLGSTPYLMSTFVAIYPTDSGTKLILKQNTVGYEVYSLPGSFPCYECSNGIYTGNIAGGYHEKHSSLSPPYPNPTSNMSRIEYQLPEGIKSGELIFFNTKGTEVKRFQITDKFNFIYVSAADLEPGVYYYTLHTSAGSNEGKKMVVVR